MAIYIPGKRDPRHKRKIVVNKRNIMVELSLTSMVDIFTILVIFLLQHYSSTGEILYIPKEVSLPQAEQVKELRPAHVVSVTDKDVILDKETVAKLDDVKSQKDWMIPALREKLAILLQKDEVTFKEAIKAAIGGNKPADQAPPEDFKKVTVQADKQLDFLTIKKIMFTLTEAGASEINFAVMKKETPIESENL
ncbi:MAG: biopolymer transporter ExbD [Oligoflexia bacterium]|nr:biopolymer transporter ExbD [Oligoflexia bacterium]